MVQSEYLAKAAALLLRQCDCDLHRVVIRIAKLPVNDLNLLQLNIRIEQKAIQNIELGRRIAAEEIIGKGLRTFQSFL